MRNSECGMRNGSEKSRATSVSQLFRIPHSPFRIVFLLAACTPVTTRPDFLPDPQASRLVLDAPPARVTPEIAVLVAAESLQVERVNVRDGYVETTWYDTRSRRSFRGDRKSTRLNSSHLVISYAVFCLKKKRKRQQT